MSKHFIQPVTRREMLRVCSGGFGALACAGLSSLWSEAEAAPAAAKAAGPGKRPGGTRENPLAPKPPHFAPRAKRVIFLFMHGGPSQVDTFDPKPLLTRDSGKPYPFEKPRVQFAGTGNLLRSPWEFKKYGQSGIEVSDLFPNVGGCADDLCVIRSLHADNTAHGGALLQLHTGSDTFVRPSVGSWIVYGLGTENENLPGFITICPTLGHGGVRNFSSAFLPALYQGTGIGNASIPASRAQINHIKSLEKEPARQRRQLDLLQEMNRETLKAAQVDSQLEARIESFELAFRMQTEAPKWMDITGESAATLDLYGIGKEPTDNFGRQCLLARRYAQAGVRFIQCTHSYKWDQHGDLKRDHARNAAEVDLPIAGLLKDLKAHGLLKDTLVVWGGEFGRTPTAQGDDGRDHNPNGFSMWMAGAGVKGGLAYGATDDYGYYAVQNKVHMHDLHATILHLLGLDHTKLTYRYAGRDFRLTDVSGNVVKDILT
ncbi:MAG TPA: DUF1501 domain-containing protein [Armatimonadota bacterium]|nr:DUF1501 domain-containing protein [Armatimonadota bacterium]